MTRRFAAAQPPSPRSRFHRASIHTASRRSPTISARHDWDDILRDQRPAARPAGAGRGGLYAEHAPSSSVYGMGITQHRLGTANVQQMVNLLLLRGNIGKPGAGICPVRGHSNVQGDRTDRASTRSRSRNSSTSSRRCSASSRRGRTGTTSSTPSRRWWTGAPRSSSGMGGNFVSSGAGLDRGRGGDAPAAADRRGQHQAQPRSSGPRRRGADPALPGAQRDRHAGERTAVGHGRRQHVDGACLVRPRRSRRASI